MQSSAAVGRTDTMDYVRQHDTKIGGGPCTMDPHCQRVDRGQDPRTPTRSRATAASDKRHTGIGLSVGLLIERSLVRLPAGELSSQLGQLSLNPSGVGKLSIGLYVSFKAECVHLWRVAGNTV